jgi:DNA-binding response OmpR family regulator
MPLSIAKGLVLDADTCKAQQNIKLVNAADFDIRFASSLEEFNQSAASGLIDFMMIHELPNTHGLDIVSNVRKIAPRMPMILLCEAASGTWEQLVSDPQLELVSSDAPPQEIRHRISKLLQFKSNNQPPKARVPVDPIPSLRSENGRLDAKKIARSFGITVSDLARAVDRSYSTVNKTPDSAALQSSLYSFERIASAIRIITGGKVEQGLKIWLNAPNKALPDSLPVDLIKEGHAGMLADMLEDVLLAHPS